MSLSERVRTVKNSHSFYSWNKCSVCTDGAGGVCFKSSQDFRRHLREHHCTKEGGSFVCRYGPNGVCPSLPLEGVSDRDYEDHVNRDHAETGTVLF